jgi:RNA polymerase sigma-70 factor (ECF subfamily)
MGEHEKERSAFPGNGTPVNSNVPQLVESLFRHEAGRIIATLIRIFGLGNMALAEDLVQDALLRALRVWSYGEIPRDPAAWIMQVAKNQTLDLLRRESYLKSKEQEIVRWLEQRSLDAAAFDSLFLNQEIEDDQLRMMFACCHPMLSPESQVALTLKTLCGFSVSEISRAFLTSEAALAKKLVRARQKIKEADIPFEIPSGEGLQPRLDSVLHTLYLLFNEGYKASCGESLVREELCKEAVRLTGLLVKHPAGNLPKTHALLALMLLAAGRLSTRIDPEGNILLLKDQDRSEWDRTLISQGLLHLAQSSAGDEISEYHLQAGIAACHCAAQTYESTNWDHILSLYNRLITINHSPVVALNRAIAVAQVHDPRAGIEAVSLIPDQKRLKSYYLFYAVLAEFHWQLEDYPTAAAHYRRALELSPITAERSFLTRRLQSSEELTDL